MDAASEQYRDDVRQILIVDDSHTSARLFVALLESPGRKVRVVSNGRAALDACKDWRPDLIVLDLELSDLDGFEVMRRLKQDPATGAVVVLAVSALDNGSVAEQALRTGADHFMSKPFSGVALRGTVSGSWSGSRGRYTELRGARPMLQVDSPPECPRS